MRNVRHTKRLTDELINENIVRILSSLEVLKTRYSEMHDVKMTQFHAQRIADTMPKTSLAKFDFMDVKEKTRENGTTYFEAELTKESTTAYLGMAGAIETLNFGAGTIGGFMGSLPKFIAAAAAVPYIGPVVVTGVGAALGAAGAQVGTGVSFGTPTLATTDAPTTTARDDAARAQAQSTENLAEALKGGGEGINITLPVTLDSREIARQTMKIPASTVMRNE